MGDLERKDKERTSRQKAAEHLIDLAYALTAGGSLQLTVGGGRVTVPLADELRLERGVKAKGNHVELEVPASGNGLRSGSVAELRLASRPKTHVSAAAESRRISGAWSARRWHAEITQNG
jgi:amphi-Trp domain-containing protein